jgi:GNAT superfamily N-acetyltransferase
MSGATGRRLEPVDDLSTDGLSQVRRIYEAGFAVHLRADFSELVTGRQPGELPLALTDNGQPLGFAMLRPLAGTGWIFLRYFVVDEQRRGQGLGGILWDLLTARLAEAGFSLLVFDVEDPDEPGTDSGEVVIRNRRIAFYQRHDARLLPVQGYRTPHDEAGDPDWTPMRLMAAALTAGGPAAGDRGLAEQVVAAVYAYRWLLPPDHPQVLATGLTGPEQDGPAPL